MKKSWKDIVNSVFQSHFNSRCMAGAKILYSVEYRQFHQAIFDDNTRVLYESYVATNLLYLRDALSRICPSVRNLQLLQR